MNAQPTTALRLQAALRNLEASRAALRGEMLPQSQASAGAGARKPAPWRNPLRQLRRIFRRWPITSLASQAVQRWWEQNPWRDTGELLAGGLVAQAAPMVRRHPLAAVAVAGAVGAAVAAGRPWRWPVVGDQLRPLPNRITRWLLAQLSTVPVQTALAGLLMKSVLDDDNDGASKRASGDAASGSQDTKLQSANAADAERAETPIDPARSGPVRAAAPQPERSAASI